jgi:putative tryptophan/tyrosine transport system substrate-binding protein
MNGGATQTAPRENLAAFVEALGKLGWSGERKLQIDLRWGGVDGAGFNPGAAELVALAPEALLVATTPGLHALRAQAGRIPIVFAVVIDPVGQGFVANLARPEGSITGFSNYDAPMAGKWLGLLKEIAPSLVRAATLYNPQAAPFAPLMQRSLEAAAPGLAMTIEAAPAQSDREIDHTIAAVASKPGSGLVILPDGFTAAYSDRIVKFIARHRVPAIYPYSTFARYGGLISYGIVTADLFRRAAQYIDRILAGAKPGDLPVQAPTKFEMVINLKTAKALGLAIPPTLLARADAVVE